MNTDANNEKFHVFTICSNNYLAQAFVLGNSVLKNNSSATFSIFLLDKKSELINYNQFSEFNIIPIDTILPEVNELANRYNIVEFNTSVKPLVFLQLLETGTWDKFIYLDPDIMVFEKLDLVLIRLNTSQILLTPHILSPIDEDGFYPDDNAFLKFGIFNLGFLAIYNGREAKKMLLWWKNHTLLKGYSDTSKGQYTDQLPMSLVPVLFKNVEILYHPGLNMAPWNLHERYLVETDSLFYLTTGERLIFYHFSDFSPTNDLLLSKNGWYNRFKMAQRNDLKHLYEYYREALLINNYETYRKIPCYYFKNEITKKSFKGFLIRVLKKVIRIIGED